MISTVTACLGVEGRPGPQSAISLPSSRSKSKPKRIFSLLHSGLCLGVLLEREYIGHMCLRNVGLCGVISHNVHVFVLTGMTTSVVLVRERTISTERPHMSAKLVPTLCW
jgi:hypothetical protein